MRWSIEPANAVGKQQMGVGQARNRVKNAVERTVPFGMLDPVAGDRLVRPAGYHPDDLLARRLAEPWYQTKTEPSFEDMITKLRKTLIVARFTPIPQASPIPTYYTTTPWPAPQPPRNRETRVPGMWSVVLVQTNG